MRRLSNEDGREAAARNFGRLALSITPWVLAIGASAWLGFYIGVHKFRRVLAQEARAAIAVGAEERPKDKLKIDLISGQQWCAPVVRADVDGDTLRLYAKNTCSKPLSGMDYHYEMLAPDGTILYDGWDNQRSGQGCSTPRLKGDTAECVLDNLPSDDRVATLRVWTVPYSDK